MDMVSQLFVRMALAACLVLGAGPHALAGDGGLHIMTSYYPPYNYTENGDVQGMAVDVVREIMHRLGVAARIDIKPWRVAYQSTQFLSGHAFFSVPRTRANDILFRWVGPLVESDIALFARRSDRITVRSLGGAAKYRIGAMVDSPEEGMLRENRMPHFELDSDPRHNLLKLLDGDIDLWMADRRGALDTVRMAGLDAVMLAEVLAVGRSRLYIAFSLATPEETVLAWQGALDAMKADGSYEAVVARHAKP
ncbi:MAG: substrate-binding periplasmic protein [Desulfovibrionaceae bacterium]